MAVTTVINPRQAAPVTLPCGTACVPFWFCLGWLELLSFSLPSLFYFFKKSNLAMAVTSQEVTRMGQEEKAFIFLLT